MREHVVQLACDPAALARPRPPALLLARVLELGEQQLGRSWLARDCFRKYATSPSRTQRSAVATTRRGRAP